MRAQSFNRRRVVGKERQIERKGLELAITSQENCSCLGRKWPQKIPWKHLCRVHNGQERKDVSTGSFPSY